MELCTTMANQLGFPLIEEVALWSVFLGRRPFRLCRNSFMEKHVGRIVCYNGEPTGFSAHRRGCLVERVSC